MGKEDHAGRIREWGVDAAAVRANAATTHSPWEIALRIVLPPIPRAGAPFEGSVSLDLALVQRHLRKTVFAWPTVVPRRPLLTRSDTSVHGHAAVFLGIRARDYARGSNSIMVTHLPTSWAYWQVLT